MSYHTFCKPEAEESDHKHAAGRANTELHVSIPGDRTLKSMIEEAEAQVKFKSEIDKQPFRAEACWEVRSFSPRPPMSHCLESALIANRQGRYADDVVMLVARIDLVLERPQYMAEAKRQSLLYPFDPNSGLSFAASSSTTVGQFCRGAFGSQE